MPLAQHRARGVQMLGPLCALLSGVVACAQDAVPGLPVTGLPGFGLSGNGLPGITVTATRVSVAADALPADVSVIRGEELRSRGASDLQGALRLVAGVEAPPGGDAGPSSAVPSLWGLHEFDAFLLVVDGVPWGGAFNPAIASLNLNDVERIEVLRGAAPVIYGATSFVGVIQVIHYAADEASNEIGVHAGSFGALQASGAIALASPADYHHAIAFDAQHQGFPDGREVANGMHVLYRASTTVADGQLRLDGNLSLQHQIPPSPVVREGAALTTRTPLDANDNPDNARIDETRLQVALGYTKPVQSGAWETTLSVANTDITDIRGFLRSSLINDGSANADSQDQTRHIADAYFDSHLSNSALSNPAGTAMQWVLGADMLYGRGAQTSRNGEYFAALSGAGRPPATNTIHVDEVNALVDRRLFWGQYAQLGWTPLPRWSVLAGLRLNETDESKRSGHADTLDPGNNASANAQRQSVRLSGVIGASYAFWQHGTDQASAFADFRTTFKPSAIDFGPDYTPTILEPESALSYEAGIKDTLAEARLSFKLSVFQMNLRSLVLQTTDANGNPLLANAGGEKLRGMDVESRWGWTPALSVVADLSVHNARFTEGTASEGGANVDLAGKQLTLSPRYLAGLGLLYDTPQGLYASGSLHYVGSRFLDLANQATAGGYATLEASVGWRLERYALAIRGSNLTDRRPPVTQSEFGDLSYYLLPGRSVWLSLTARL